LSSGSYFLNNQKVNNQKEMNKGKFFIGCRKHYGNTIQNFVVGLLVLVNCFACTNQANQNVSKQAKETVETNTTETSEYVDNLILNQYKNDKKEGLWKEYYENGKLKAEGSYAAGLKEGLHKEWANDGVLLLEGYYKKGKANGLMKWFQEKGLLAGEGNMIDDIRDGKWKICDIRKNEFCIEAFFKDGKREGIWKIYHEKAKDKLWKEQTWKNDKIVAEKCWDESGNKIECI